MELGLKIFYFSKSLIFLNEGHLLSQVLSSEI